jgi:hypothetical protein
MHKKLALTMPLAVLLACVAVATFSQDRLAVSSTRPKVDGVVQAGEYTYSHDFDQKLTLYASRTSDTCTSQWLHQRTDGCQSDWAPRRWTAP